MVVKAEHYRQPEKNALNRDHHQKPVIFQKKTDIWRWQVRASSYNSNKLTN